MANNSTSHMGLFLNKLKALRLATKKWERGKKIILEENSVILNGSWTLLATLCLRILSIQTLDPEFSYLKKEEHKSF